MSLISNFRNVVFLLLFLLKERTNTVSNAFVVPRPKICSLRGMGEVNQWCAKKGDDDFIVRPLDDGELQVIENFLNFEEDVEHFNYGGHGQYEIDQNRVLSDEIMSDYEIVLQDDLPSTIEDDDESESSLKVKEEKTETIKKTKHSPITMSDLSSLTTTTSSDIAYFYLKNNLGFSEEDMWKVTEYGPSVLGLTAENLRKKVKLLRSLMDLTDDEVRHIILRMPALLCYSAKGNVAPTALFLQRSFDLSRKDLKTLLLDYPSILGYSMRNLKTKLNFYFKICGFTKEEARKLFLKEPKLLTAGVRTGLIPRMHFLVQELEIPLDVFREIVMKNPTILLSSLEMNLRPKLIFYLILNVGLDVKQVQTLLRRFPHFTVQNLDNKILPTQRYFCEELNFTKAEYGKILLKDPRIIQHSLVNKIKHVVGYLRYELGLSSSEVRHILYNAPQVMNLHTETNLKEKIAYFQNTFNFTNAEVNKVVTGMPSLLLCSLEKNIIPKVNYLRNVGLEANEVSKMILVSPVLLKYSFEKRIQPRMEKLIEKKIKMTSLSYLITKTESDFEQCLSDRKSERKDTAIIQVYEEEVKNETNITHKGRIQHWTRPRQDRSKKPSSYIF